MSKTLNKTIAVLVYIENTLLALSNAISGVSLFFSTAVFGTPLGIASNSIILVFIVTNGFVRMFLETMGREKYTQKYCFVIQN